jgi:multidrug efflux pump subunit AcrB
MAEATDVELVPLTTRANRQQAAQLADSPSNPTPPLLIRDVARVMRSEMPGEVDRYNMRRYLSLTANIEGEDLGRVIDRLDAAIARAGRPPRGIEVDLRGQVRPMREMFRSLEIGLAVAVVVILIMLTAYFQAPRLALSAVASVPAVLAGVVLALWITRTTLNIESFMGAIMAVGVAVSNAIMLVSFGDRHRLEEGMPADRAAITAAKGRLRPIIMTGCAMIAGMIPMSLGLEEGSEQNAPPGQGGDRGHGLRDVRHAPGPAGRLHAPARPCLQPVPLARPGRPGELPLRSHPPGTRRRGRRRRPPRRRPRGRRAAPPASNATGGHAPCRRQRQCLS